MNGKKLIFENKMGEKRSKCARVRKPGTKRERKSNLERQPERERKRENGQKREKEKELENKVRKGEES